MLPLLALAFIIGLIAWLLNRERKRHHGLSSAVWLAVMWAIIVGSRPVSSWFQAGAASTPDGYLEGSPIDASFYLILIVAGSFVLFRRQISFPAIIRSNKWLFVFFAYCAVSVLWSDYPFVAFKRWFKDFGNVIMALVILTDEQPTEAVKAVFTRCAYVLVPLSLLFIRYYPNLGRTFTGYQGDSMMYVGVATHKNTFGALLFVCCTFVLFDVIGGTGTRLAIRDLFRRADSLLIVALSIQLLFVANSATSKLCTLIVIGVYCATGLHLFKNRLRFLGTYGIAGVATWYVLDFLFSINEIIVNSLGRDMSFTSRTTVWDIVLKSQVSPLIGAGFLSFWMGDRMAMLWKEIGGIIVQSHDGYVETYLNLGLVGLFLLAIMFLSSFQKIKRRMMTGDDFSRMRFAFWIVALFYNFSETAFSTMNLLWFVTVLIVLEVPEALHRGTNSMAVSSVGFGKKAVSSVTFGKIPSVRQSEGKYLKHVLMSR